MEQEDIAMEELKPCPFCGGAAGVDKMNFCFEDTGEYAMSAFVVSCSAFVVSCRVCGMKTAQYRTEEKAVKAWNRRAERTCRIVVDHGRHGPEPRFDGDVWTVHDACSECGWPIGRKDAYCSHCGARVVG